MSSSSNWKNNERIWARILQEFKVPATRRTRAGNWSQSTDDVGIEDHPEVISDCKFSEKGFKVNRLLAETEDKYEKNKEDYTFLLTRGYAERGMTASLDARMAACMLSYWLGYGTKEELLKIYLKEKVKEEE